MLAPRCTLPLLRTFWRAPGREVIATFSNKVALSLQPSVSSASVLCRAAGLPLERSQRGLHPSFPLAKYKKSAQNEDSDDENETSSEFKDERDSKVVRTKVNSLRADLLLKAGLGLARNKVEAIFYESKIRVNGKKLPKKSVQLRVGDEIDVIRGFSHTNASHLVIARVVILSADPRGAEDEGLSVHLRRYKSMLVENYSGADVFKSSEVVSP